MSVLETAEQYIGTPYIWGGTSPAQGFDCSGLTKFAYQKNGVEIPRTAQEQYNSAQKIEANDLKAGDLIFFGSSNKNINHVAMYAGNGQIIEAPRPGGLVHLTKLSGRKNVVGYGSYGAGTTTNLPSDISDNGATEKQGILSDITSKIVQFITIIALFIIAVLFFLQSFGVSIPI